jgi:hypothetical protein
MPAVAGSLKNRYCRGCYEACARFQVYKEFGHENVTDGLFTHEGDMVSVVVEGLRQKLKKQKRKGVQHDCYGC